jgi:hypothetical protein
MSSDFYCTLFVNRLQKQSLKKEGGNFESGNKNFDLPSDRENKTG